MKYSKFICTALIACAITACGDDANSRAQNKQNFEERQKALDAQHKREIECIQASGNKDCDTSQINQVVQTNNPQAVMQVPPSYNDANEIAPGTYHNYYGNPQYGTWGPDNVYHFNNPTSYQASQTTAFLAGAAIGGIAGHLLTKSEYTKQNPQGWQDRTTVVNNYIDKSGKSISSDEYYKRRAQSYKDKLNNEKQKNQSLQAQGFANKTQSQITQPSLQDKIAARNVQLQQRPQAIPQPSLQDKIAARNVQLQQRPQQPTQSLLQDRIQARNVQLQSAPKFTPSNNLANKIQTRNKFLSSKKR